MPNAASCPQPAEQSTQPKLLRSWKKALGYGFLLWLIPFVVSMALFPIRQGNRPLFESIMPLVEAICTIFFLRLYLRHGKAPGMGESLLLGVLWMGISLLFDWPMFAAGPMKMTPAAYLSDIGAAYLLFPVLTVGAASLLRPPPPTGRKS